MQGLLERRTVEDREFYFRTTVTAPAMRNTFLLRLDYSYNRANFNQELLLYFREG